MKKEIQSTRRFRFLLLPFTFLLFTCLSSAQTIAPGAPGKDAQWATAGKQAVGTSANLESKIWFTLAEGALTEVYYPDVTVANVHLLQFVIVNRTTRKVETEQDDGVHEIIIDSAAQPKTKSSVENINADKNYRLPASLAFTQISKSKATVKNGIEMNGLIIGDNKPSWIITKKYVTNPENNSVIISVEFVTKDPNNDLYIYFDPSLANTGMKDTAWTKGNTLLAKDGDIFSALSCRYCKLSETTNGFFGVNEGLTQLKKSGKIENFYDRAENGNVVQTAKITPVYSTQSDKSFNFEIALGFGANENAAEKASVDSLLGGFEKAKGQYRQGWIDYLKTLRKVEPKYQAQFNMAAMVLKAQEDKTVRGANIASLTIPWGGGANANEDVGGGYHLVWSRDLYHVFTAYLALGDTAAAGRALDFLFNIQQKPDGSFPQNSWLDGTRGWGSLQMDEVAYPLIMAYQLKRFDRKTYENHVKRAADFIVKNGPKTPQERWEEKSGYSPSTIAAEIAGLVCAAEIARRNGDGKSAAIYLKTADEWAANVEKWTATTNGKYGDGNYYIRLTENGTPDAKEKTVLNNNAGTFIENEIVDAGFLELVRLGIKPPDDPLIVKSVKIVDQLIKVNTPNGESFYRYNNDGYGEMDDGRRWNWDGKYTGKGRLWALLAGERGQYELAMQRHYLDQYNKKIPNSDRDKTRKNAPAKPDIDYLIAAKKRLDAMAKFANEGLMIPEQVWDKAAIPKNIDKQFIPELKFGEGNGSATPLAWSMAQFIRLAVNLQEGRNLDTPDIVYERYVLEKKAEKQADETNKVLDLKRSGRSGEEKELVITNPLLTPCETAEDCRDKSNEMLACFAYKGEFQTIAIAGDFTNWKPKTLTKIERLPELKGSNGTTYDCLAFAKTARVEYKLIVDGKWIADPLNSNVIDNGVGGENSFFEMPEYKPTAWANSEGMTKDAISIERIDSKIYGVREARVYVPDGFSEKVLPVMYFQDGTDYQKRADAITVQRNLVKAGKIKPFIMVFLDPKDRNKEYWAADDYARFLASEVVPAIDAKYKTVKAADARAVIGASLGGITSVHVGLKYPEIFGRVGGQSSSFWIDDERVVKALEKLDSSKNKIRFYFDDGSLEGAEDSRSVVKLLKEKGFAVAYNEREAGHNWTAWRDRLADAFTAIWN